MAQPASMESLALLAVGAFIVIAGTWSRVTGLQLSEVDLTVVYAARRARSTRLADIRELRPPRTPGGGWKLETAAQGRGATLMPSDLLGHEAMLDLIVVRSSLRFDGRSWIRHPA
jgi:hypothetical protein